MTTKRSRHEYESGRSSSQAQPPFVFYGTSLPPLDSETRDDGSYVPVWKQEVRDERGRKRLHGAFTGGFSAGYFNTVGSKEGWSPSTFVSSRGDKSKQKATMTVEDVMDEEDLADLEESRKLDTQNGFAALGATADEKVRRDPFSDLFRESTDTMGIRLLQRMGWKPGQGIGPKVRRWPKLDREGLEDGRAERSRAPDDVPMVTLSRKTDRFGLGWAAASDITLRPNREPDQPDGEDTVFALRSKINKPKAKPSGIGVGVLNDTGSDDEDPYEIGPRISYNKIIGGEKRKKKGGLVSATTIGRPLSKSVIAARQLTGSGSGTAPSFKRCHDGRPALEGFVLAAQALSLDDHAKYAPPAVPTGWVPSKTKSATTGQQNSDPAVADAPESATLDPFKRAALLGEATLPGKSIFDYISPAARNRLATASGANLPQGRGEGAPEGFEQTAAEKQKTLWDLVPSLERAAARAALERGSAGWMPYAEDSAKRARYRSFLESMAGVRQGLPDKAANASNDEWAAEMREFAQAAMVFKPVSGLMASRFTSAKGGDGPKKASDNMAGVDTSNTLYVSAEQTAKAADPAEEAAKLGMYGLMTRTKAEFYPTRLTCKRFGVKPPNHVLQGPDSTDAQKERLDVVNRTRMDELTRDAATNMTRKLSSGEELAVSASQAPRAALPVIDIERNEAIEGQRAGEELFKAVFGSDDDSD